MNPEVPLKSVYRGHYPSGVSSWLMHVDTRSGRIPSKAVDLRGGCQEAVEWLDKGLSEFFQVERRGWRVGKASGLVAREPGAAIHQLVPCVALVALISTSSLVNNTCLLGEPLWSRKFSSSAARLLCDFGQVTSPLCSWFSLLYLFHMAAITNDHKPGGLKQ